MVVRHRHTPVGHRTRLVTLGDRRKNTARLFELERVEQRHGAVEIGPHVLRARGFEAHLTHLVSGYLGHYLSRKEKEQAQEQSRKTRAHTGLLFVAYR
jgi:hypothetical protein